MVCFPDLLRGLPPGDYPLTIEELRDSFLVGGPQGAGRGWDAAWRLKLVNNLEILARQLEHRYYRYLRQWIIHGRPGSAERY